MPPIGRHRFILGYTRPDEEILYGHRPIFGQRQQYLPLVGRMACQVLILAYGDYVWINVDPQNICLN